MHNCDDICLTGKNKVMIGNARKLREFLTAARPLITIESLASERGCGPSGIDMRGVSIDRENGEMLDTTSKKHIQIQPQGTGEQPEIERRIVKQGL